jgi:hypothetical protein
LMAPKRDALKAETHFERALAGARTQQAKSWELRAAVSLAPLAFPGQAAASAVGSGLRVVFGGVRHARPEGGEGAAGGVGGVTVC